MGREGTALYCESHIFLLFATDRTLEDKGFQRELKTIIALFLRDVAQGQIKQDPICGKKCRVAMRSFQGSNVQDVFDFKLRDQKLRLNPIVFSFIVTAL